MNRRDFINLSLLSSSLLLFPELSFSNTLSKKHLILVELDGGNDGLNTIVPLKEKNYYNLRPNLSLGKKDIFKINENYGLNKNLWSFYDLFKEENLAIINGLGYDKPNLSHFRSIEIVETASDSNEVLDYGWISSILKDTKVSLKQPAHGIILGNRKKGHLFSNNLDILHIKSIENFLKDTSRFNSSSSSKHVEILEFLNKQNLLIIQAKEAFEISLKNINIEETFEDTDISFSFKEAAKIIKSPIQMPVIKISHKGYDTHSNHLQRHEELLGELNGAINSFVKQMKRDKLFDDILIVTYSEFGRRVKENASFGIDHGTAAPHFAIGGLVKGGIYEQYPSLDNLYKDNLIYTTHYRSYYNTILKSWFNNKNNIYSRYKDIGFL